MENIKAYLDLLSNPKQHEIAMDSSHCLHIIGSLLSKKPDNVLEIGIGKATLTAGLVMGLRYNRKGRLTCVDNWIDWGGNEPSEIAVLREAGVTIIAPVEEKDFLYGCPGNSYDFVVSDGDHFNCDQWVDQYIRITKPDGFIYFHDTNNHMFPNLDTIRQRVKQLGLPHFHFTQSSREDEQCERGLLFVINTKSSDHDVTPFKDMFLAAKLKSNASLWEEALELFKEILIHNPNDEDSLICAGSCLQYLNRHEEALDYYELALRQNPDNVDTHFNKALALLVLGRYQEGWQEYEWRLNKISTPLPPFPFLSQLHLKQGIAGKSILIHSEQGFGDSILCIRFVSLLADLGSKIIVSIQPELRRLFTSVHGISCVISHGELLPNCDFQIAMMSLPGVLGVTLENIPTKTPYLHPQPDEIILWRDRIQETGTLKIGLTWEAKQNGLLSSTIRSLKLEEMLIYLNNSNYELHNLQINVSANDCKLLDQYKITDMSKYFNDFADTAAFISNLDLIITVDTAIAHLAGALGKKVFLLLPWVQEWRWIVCDGKPAWYPEISIFKQTKPGDWSTPLQAMCSELSRLPYAGVRP